MKTTGNHIADYHEEWIRCDKCKGEGYIEDPDSDTGEDVECPECNGKGGYTKKW